MRKIFNGKHAKTIAIVIALFALSALLAWTDKRAEKKESATSYPIRNFYNATTKSFVAVGSQSTNTAVGLWKTDDKSGRQRFLSQSLGNGANNIVVSGGRKGPMFLSASPDGSKIVLVDKDDGSGLQRWAFKNLYNRTFEISIVGGKGLAKPKANLLSIDLATNKLVMAAPASVLWGDGARSRQLWQIVTPGTALPVPDKDLPGGCPTWAHPRSESYVASRVAMLKDRAKQQFTVSQFGDSITARLDTQPEFDDFVNYYCQQIGIPRSQWGNFGISGDTVQTFMHRLCNGGCPSNNKVVVFHIGTNNLRCDGDGNTPQQVALKAFKCIDFVRSKNPNAKVVIASIFNRGSLDEKRRATNAEIKKIIDARKDPNITFTTAGESLTMENTFDRLHPNPNGWRQVFDAGFGISVKKALDSAR
jgi:lysophospholipase L1-like esterase